MNTTTRWIVTAICILAIWIAYNQAEKNDVSNRYDNLVLENGTIYLDNITEHRPLFSSSPNFGENTYANRQKADLYIAAREKTDKAYYGRLIKENRETLEKTTECTQWEVILILTSVFLVFINPIIRWIFIGFVGAMGLATYAANKR